MSWLAHNWLYVLAICGSVIAGSAVLGLIGGSIWYLLYADRGPRL